MKTVHILLFPDFETLDAFGPVEVLGHVPEYRLRYISAAGGVVLSRQGVPVLTESMSGAGRSGILLVPGGQGTRPLIRDAAFIRRLAEMAAASKYCLTVCTGSALLAQTGLLDGRNATSNKNALAWVRSVRAEVRWAGRARWAADQKYYTASGVSAGMDMTLGFIADRFGASKARQIAESMEYVWNADPGEDRFAQ